MKYIKIDKDTFISALTSNEIGATSYTKTVAKDSSDNSVTVSTWS